MTRPTRVIRHTAEEYLKRYERLLVRRALEARAYGKQQLAMVRIEEAMAVRRANRHLRRNVWGIG